MNSLGVIKKTKNTKYGSTPKKQPANYLGWMCKVEGLDRHDGRMTECKNMVERHQKDRYRSESLLCCP